MTSILTNNAASSALSNLRRIDAGLGNEQSKVATGLRIGAAADNAAYWSIATTMKSDNKALSTVKDALSLGAATVDVAYSGMTASLSAVTEIQSRLVAAREPGVDKLKINKDITELKSQIYAIVDSASFAGQNWLHRFTDADDTDKEVVGGFTRDANGNVAVQTLSYGMMNAVGTNHLIDENYHNGILTNVEFARDLGTATEWVLISGRNHAIHENIELTQQTTPSDLEEMISVVDKMMGAMIDAAAGLGAVAKRITMQHDFISTLSDTVTRGIGTMVDAEMNESSIRLKAFQTQQQLATQSLSIANANAGNILSLFR